MIKKIVKYLKVIPIDVLVYAMTEETLMEYPTIDFKIESAPVDHNKKKFFITVDDNIIHESYLFRKLFLLKLLHKKGPAIGDCKTIETFKGKSIYPFVINHIAREEIQKNHIKEVFIISKVTDILCIWITNKN